MGCQGGDQEAVYAVTTMMPLATPPEQEIEGLVARWTALAELYERDAGDTEAALFRETASEYARMARELRETEELRAQENRKLCDETDLRMAAEDRLAKALRLLHSKY